VNVDAHAAADHRLRVPSADDAELSGARKHRGFADSRERVGGGIVGGEPGDEALPGDVIGEEEHLIVETQRADVRIGVASDDAQFSALAGRCPAGTS
jgi:hypothetical protein